MHIYEDDWLCNCFMKINSDCSIHVYKVNQEG